MSGCVAVDFGEPTSEPAKAADTSSGSVHFSRNYTKCTVHVMCPQHGHCQGWVNMTTSSTLTEKQQPSTEALVPQRPSVPLNPPTVPKHIKIMTAYGYDAPLQSGWSSFGKSFNLSALIEGFQQHGLPGMYRIDCIGCTKDADRSPGFAAGIICESRGSSGGKVKRLCSKSRGDTTNWDEQTKKLLGLAQPHLKSGALVGIFLGEHHHLT